MHVRCRKSPLVLMLLGATFLTPPGSARAAPGDVLGGEFRVNVHDLTGTADQDLAIAMDAEGDFVATWEGGGSGDNFGIFARRFDATGVALGSEFRVNTAVSGNQLDPAAAMDADGDFVVAWDSFGQDGSGYGVYAQRFDAAGNPVGPEFRVNTTTTGRQRSPSVAMDADGDFTVAWWGNGPGDDYGIFVQRFDAAGTPLGSEVLVNTATADRQLFPAVAMDADGDFVVTWQSEGSGFGFFFAQRFDAAGSKQGAEFQVNTTIANNPISPGFVRSFLDMDADGDFVVVWNSYDQDGDTSAIFARRFDAAGLARDAAEFPVNATTTNFQGGPAVAMDADGDFVVAWMGYGPGDGSGIFARRYAAAGNPLGGEVLVNTVTSQNQSTPAVAMDADGDFVVTWKSYAFDSDFGIFAQRYQGDGPVPWDFTMDGRADILWRNAGTGNAILWQMDGFTSEAAASIGAPSTDWQVAGVADFNADTKADILWRNTTTGAALIWRMDGFTKSAAGGIGKPPLAWQVVGTGDFDGDDHADILWRNTTTGAAVIWKMDGFTRLAVGVIGAPPLAWEVAGVGDFDADAKSDILWRNTTTGAALIWKMDGFAKDGSASIGKPALAWQVKGLGDFDGDARADILWRHGTSGNTIIWKMNGLTKDAAASIGAPPLVWDLEGAGDSDGDRKADILWRNWSTGAAVVWKMDGFVRDAVGGIGNVPLVWEVQ
jgi:hypothetical protein